MGGKMKILAIIFGTIQFLLLNNVAFSKLQIEDCYKYFVPRSIIQDPIYTDYLNLDRLPLMTQFVPVIRQSSPTNPGDYFYPADTYINSEFIAKDLHVQLTTAEIKVIEDFLKENLLTRFSDSVVLSSLKGYNFIFRDGLHREPYTMLSEGDTVYVISGWLGKFLSFYRVVPGDFRLKVPELMQELEKITPISQEIKEGSFRHVSDSLNYLLEYVDKDKMFRVRNYLMKTVLPPDPPDGKEKYYNLIEITKFYDKGAIP
jgi:hypothetical protein